MIEINFELFLWCIFILYIFSGLTNIFTGAMKIERDRNYGMGEVVMGLVMLLIVFMACVF